MGRRPSLLAGSRGPLAVVLPVLLALATSWGPAGRAAADGTTVLQLNLCGSGYAVCWTGRSVDRAVDVVRADPPEVLTLNEVCEPDVERLRRAVVATGPLPRHGAVARFEPVTDARTGQAVRCRGGGRYGVGVVVRRAAADGVARAWAGTYPLQDRHQAEQRVWLCLAVPGRPVACTTHLASGSPAFALGQCRYLFDRVVRALGPRTPVVVAGDLNLRNGNGSALRPCASVGTPTGTDVDDGGVQHVVTNAGERVTRHRLVGMRGTTDHPGLVVTVASAVPGSQGLS